jgi:hypothetical protein
VFVSIRANSCYFTSGESFTYSSIPVLNSAKLSNPFEFESSFVKSDLKETYLSTRASLITLTTSAALPIDIFSFGNQLISEFVAFEKSLIPLENINVSPLFL